MASRPSGKMVRRQIQNPTRQLQSHRHTAPRQRGRIAVPPSPRQILERRSISRHPDLWVYLHRRRQIVAASRDRQFRDPLLVGAPPRSPRRHGVAAGRDSAGAGRRGPGLPVFDGSRYAEVCEEACERSTFLCSYGLGSHCAVTHKKGRFRGTWHRNT